MLKSVRWGGFRSFIRNVHCAQALAIAISIAAPGPSRSNAVKSTAYESEMHELPDADGHVDLHRGTDHRQREQRDEEGGPRKLNVGNRRGKGEALCPSGSAKRFSLGSTANLFICSDPPRSMRVSSYERQAGYSRFAGSWTMFRVNRLSTVFPESAARTSLRMAPDPSRFALPSRIRG